MLFSFYVIRRIGHRARYWKMAVTLIALSLMCTIAVPLWVIYKPPGFLLRYFQHRWPDVLWLVSTSSKIIALTIDDGPSEYTDEIRQILKANNATATFFIIGSQVAGYEKALQELVGEGNELGNHGESSRSRLAFLAKYPSRTDPRLFHIAMYDEPSRSLSDATLVEQVQSVEEMIHKVYAAVGREPPPKYFRPGSGFFSGRMRNLLRRLGYRLVLGSIYPHDPQVHFWRMNATHILSMLRPGGIIICHDRRGWTAPMLRRVLPEIRRKGYRISTVTELLNETGTGSG